MADLKTLEHATLKVPYEILNKKFRVTQKVIDREATNVKSYLSELDQLLKTTPSSDNLNSIIEKLVTFKKKVEESITDETEAAQVCKDRLSHLQEYAELNSLSAEKWRKQRLDRMLVEYFLRAGYYDSAIELGKSSDIEHLTNMELFITSRKVEESLSAKNTALCVAWCQDNKSKLKRMKSNLEFKIRQQEYIELVKEKKILEAVKHARNFLSSTDPDKLTDIKQCMALLAYSPDTELEPYRSLFSEDRWKDLTKQFRAENFKLYQLNMNSVFSVTMQCGLSALKTRHCYVDNEKNDSCPVCKSPMSALAEKLPFAHCSHSRLICRLSGEPLNEHNPPMVLPNGHVYGYNALSVMAAEHGGKVECIKTKERYKLEDAEKVYVM
ncbi:DgyrCDS5484 [Dimorphilus gyrociliatus]|uniref:E3 ubiquitin-protein transferase MAEA n=1 Tax=Dimorphilus gyrociliatus TaxID=2664684 RepID=A0A7I8VPU3_9ANNE|nr:DgyrCDS5484 [Dimorphilus gyrociliatus]